MNENDVRNRLCSLTNLVNEKNCMVIQGKNFIFYKLIINSKFNDIIDELKSINASLSTMERYEGLYS